MGSLLIERNAKPSMRPALKLLSVRLEHENQDREESLFTSIDAPFCPFDVSRLSRLIVSINDLSEINRTLKSCCETLERLELPSLRSAHASTSQSFLIARLSYLQISRRKYPAVIQLTGSSSDTILRQSCSRAWITPSPPDHRNILPNLRPCR